MYPQATISYQNDLYNAVKGDTVLQHLPVLAPTAGNPVNYPLFRGSVFDIKNIHYYPYNLPADHIEGQLSNSDSITTDVLPRWASETGYSTYNRGATEKAEAKYMPRLLCEFFKRNVARTYLYELADRGTDTAQREDFFGLCRRDWSPKPVFYVLKNFVAALKDSGAAFIPAGLDFSLTGTTANIKYLLLQKRNGDHYLLIWNDVAAYNSNTRLELDLPPVPVTLRLANDYPNASIATFDEAGSLNNATAPVVNNVLSLNVNDRIQIIKLPSSGMAANRKGPKPVK